MRLCIPTLDDGGLAARISDHFGGAPHLTLVDSESGEAVALTSGHGNGKDCGRVGLLDGRGVDAVVVRGGIGRGALTALAQRGIQVLTSGSRSVGEVMAEARAGALRQLGVDEACSHHHGDGCAH